MNLNSSPTIEELRELIKQCDDFAGHHVLWVKKTGEVELSRNPKYLTLAEFQKIHQDMQMRVETFEKGHEYVGPEAADVEEWVSELFDRLVTEWPKAKDKPTVDYINITGLRWETNVA